MDRGFDLAFRAPASQRDVSTMSIQRQMRQRRAYRAVALGGVIVVMIAGAIVATIDSYQAEKEQRLTAARTLRDYALFASYTYSQNAFLYARARMLVAYAPLAGYGPLSRDELPPETAVLPPDEKCIPAERRQPYRFRLDLPSRALHVSRGGEGGPGLWQRLDQPGSVIHPSTAAISPALADHLRDTLALLANSSVIRRSGWGYAFIRGDRGREVVSFQATYDSSGAPMAVYGYESCYALTDQADFASLYRDVQALPPSLVGSVPHDSLYFLQVIGPEGAVLYSRGVRSPQATYMGVTPMPQLAGVNFSVTLRPSLAPRLLVGGMPRRLTPK